MKREPYGKTKKGEPVDIFTLENENGMTVKFINYGCRLTNILLPVSKEKPDVLLGCDDISGYELDDSYQGAVLGRYANRIKGASFSLGDKKYALMKNNGDNYLHGSLHTHVFEAKEGNGNEVILSSVSHEGEDGFPGEVKLDVSFKLDGDNRFIMTYKASADKDTHINISHHPYFDLSAGAEKTIETHIARLVSKHFLAAGSDFVPNGAIIDASGGAFDFTEAKAIGRDIDKDDPQLKITGGYDHSFILNTTGKQELAAEVSDQTGTKKLRVYTTQPAVHFYTGNVLPGKITGKGRKLAKRTGFCLETQHYPDSPNQTAFPSTLLKADGSYNETTILEFVF